jgi:hypothetical protein
MLEAYFDSNLLKVTSPPFTVLVCFIYYKTFLPKHLLPLDWYFVCVCVLGGGEVLTELCL